MNGKDNNEGMAPLREVLAKFSEKKDGTYMNRGQSRVQTKVEECQCESCGAKFEGSVTTYYTFVPPRVLRSRECHDCKEKRLQVEEKERQEEINYRRTTTKATWRAHCGIPDYLQLKNFKNFDKRMQTKAYQAALSWANNFNLDKPRGYPSLLLYSDHPGVGKTHLQVAIVNYLIDGWQGDNFQERSPIYFASGPALVRRIRNTYNIPQGQSHEREEDVYNEVSGVALLLLDDVGKEKPSDFTRELYWYVIDERLKSGLPVVISSRLPLEGQGSLVDLMGTDTVDRLYGMTQGNVWELRGESYRRKEGQP